MLHTHLQDLVFTPNATTGLNTVIRSCGLKQGDTMYMLDIGWVGQGRGLGGQVQDVM